MKTEKNKAANQPIFLYAIFDYDSARVAGIATSTSANHLVDINANFVAADVGRMIHNKTDNTYAKITAVNSAIDITLDVNIMASGEIYDLESNLYFTEWNANITFDGVNYTKFPITHDMVGENTQGAVEGVNVTVCNISRLIQAYLEAYDFRGKKVEIKIVWADHLDDADAYLKDYYYIDSYSADESNVIFKLTSKFDLLDLDLPIRKYMRTHCGWKFKGTECAYSGAQTTCNKTYQQCQNYGNLLRFGGFPSIPQGNIFVT